MSDYHVWNPTQGISRKLNAGTDITLTEVGDALVVAASSSGSGVTSGATLPASPEDGALHLHTPTGRTILMQYNGSSWGPILSYGTMTIYVDGTSGTDDQEKGFGTGTDAYATIQYAIDQMPGNLGGAVLCYVAAGTYVESIVLQGKASSTTANINFYGELSLQETVTSATVSAGSGATQGTVTKAGAFTGDSYANLLAYFVTDGEYRLIDSHTDDTLTLVGTAPSSTSQNIEIYDWATVLQGLFLAQYNTVSTVFYYLSIENGADLYTLGLSGGCVINVFYSKLISDSSTAVIIPQVNARLITTGCYIENTGTNAVGISMRTFSDATMRQTKLYAGAALGANRRGISSIGSTSYSLQQGCIIDDWDYGTNSGGNDVVTIFNNSSTGYIIVRNCNVTGLYADTGAQISGTTNNVYSGNTADETAVSGSYGYID